MKFVNPGECPPVVHASLSRPTKEADGFSISFPTQGGRVYALEYKNSLLDAEPRDHFLTIVGFQQGSCSFIEHVTAPQFIEMREEIVHTKAPFLSAPKTVGD